MRSARSALLFIILLSAAACTSTRQTNSLRFTQDGKWTIGSNEKYGITSYFVIDQDGEVRIIATAFDDPRREKHAFVFVDTTQKDETLKVLGRYFPSGIENTQTIEFPGPLASSDIRVEGRTIVGRINRATCMCSNDIQCGVSGPFHRFCQDRICDFVNCVLDQIAGENPAGCSDENSRLRETCGAIQ